MDDANDDDDPPTLPIFSLSTPNEDEDDRDTCRGQVKSAVCARTVSRIAARVAHTEGFKCATMKGSSGSRATMAAAAAATVGRGMCARVSAEFEFGFWCG